MMKKILIILFVLVAGIGLCAAQKAGPKNATTVFVTDIHCHKCVDKIMKNIPVLGKGIEDVNVDLEKKEVTVVYNPAKNNDENLVKGFAKLNVKALPKKAGETPAPKQ